MLTEAGRKIIESGDRNAACFHQTTKEEFATFKETVRCGNHLVNALRLGGTIENVLHNIGFERIGVVGETAEFNPLRHRSSASILPDAPAKVTKCGWLMPYIVNGKEQKRVLEKAEVIPV